MFYDILNDNDILVHDIVLENLFQNCNVKVHLYISFFDYHVLIFGRRVKSKNRYYFAFGKINCQTVLNDLPIITFATNYARIQVVKQNLNTAVNLHYCVMLPFCKKTQTSLLTRSPYSR